MKTISLGRTALPVTPMGLGLAALGRPGYINLGHAEDLAGDTEVSAMAARAHAVLDAAWAAGVRYFDAARSYGRAEAFLSDWIRARHLDPGLVTVGSKWGYVYTADWQVKAAHHEIKEHSLSRLNQQWRESRELLGDHLKLYQIHSATLESGVLDNTAVLNALAGLKAKGVGVGLSVSGPRQAEVIRRACACRIDGRLLFDTIQATWNLIERSAGPALADAHAAGMGIIVKEGLANGRLTSRNADPAFTERSRRLAQEARRLETTVDALSLAAVLAQPWTDVVLSGAARTDHLLANLKALDVRWTARTDTALAGLSETAPEYWRIRAALAWN
ncbi:MAG: aldo/keto reductase [Pseudomonadota bacterium]